MDERGKYIPGGSNSSLIPHNNVFYIKIPKLQCHALPVASLIGSRHSCQYQPFSTDQRLGKVAGAFGLIILVFVHWFSISWFIISPTILGFKCSVATVDRGWTDSSLNDHCFPSMPFVGNLLVIFHSLFYLFAIFVVHIKGIHLLNSFSYT